MAEIRSMVPEDIPFIHALERDIFKPSWSEDQLSADLRYPGGGGISIETDGRLSAYLFYRTAADELEITRLGVASRDRRHGLGEKLVKEAFSQSSLLGIKRIFLEVGASNGAAQALYLKTGFEKFGERKGYYGGAETALLFRFFLF